MSNHRQRFHQINQVFKQNPTQHNHTAIGQFYELKDELESLSKNGQATFDSDMVLFSVYQALGFYESAYQIFIKHHHKDDKANLSKIYKLADKAKSHGNRFILKDVRKAKKLITPKSIQLIIDDFVLSDEYDIDNAEAFFINKKIAIFGRYFKSEDERINVVLPKNSLQKHLPKIQDLINHFVFMDKQTLIEYYNNPPNDNCYTIQATHKKADDDWFALLELYRLQISTYGDDYLSFHVYISLGDTYNVDHLLDLEFDDCQLYKMSY